MMYGTITAATCPYSRFAQPGETTGPQPDKTVIIRDIGGPKDHWTAWLAFGSNYLDAAPKVFCSAYSGARLQPVCPDLERNGRSSRNYQYRGGISLTPPIRCSSPWPDSLRTKSEFNHKVGETFCVAISA